VAVEEVSERIGRIFVAVTFESVRHRSLGGPRGRDGRRARVRRENLFARR